MMRRIWKMNCTETAESGWAQSTTNNNSNFLTKTSRTYFVKISRFSLIIFNGMQAPGPLATNHQKLKRQRMTIYMM